MLSRRNSVGLTGTNPPLVRIAHTSQKLSVVTYATRLLKDSWAVSLQREAKHISQVLLASILP